MAAASGRAMRSVSGCESPGPGCDLRSASVPAAQAVAPAALLLSLLLLLLGAQRTAGADCGRCQCQQTYTDCEDAEMETFPTGLPETTERVYIRLCPIRELTAEVVAQMGSLPELSDFEMTDGALETVGPAALRQFSKLYEVDFSRNRIRQVAADAFPPAVELVFLSQNPLQVPSEGPLFDAPELQYLHLARCGLTDLPAEALQDFPKLHNLDIYGNQLTNLHPDTIAKNPAISFVNLDNNPLQTPEQGPLLNSDSLETLNLGNTSLKRLTADMFRGLPALENLWLRENNIETLPDDFFSALPKINTLVLSHNPLRQPPPALQELPDSLVQLDLASTGLGPTLPVPLARSRGLQLLDLSENELTELPAAALAELPQLSSLDVERNPQLRLDAEALSAALPELLYLWASDTASTCPCLEPGLQRWAEQKGTGVENFECGDDQSEPC